MRRRLLLGNLEAELSNLPPARSQHANWLAIIKLAEWEELGEHIGPHGCSMLLEAVRSFLGGAFPDGKLLIQSRGSEIALIIPDRTEKGLRRLLFALSRKIVVHPFSAATEIVRVTPAVGYVALSEKGTDPETSLRSAGLALNYALSHLDLRPTAFSDLLNEKTQERERWPRIAVAHGLRFVAQVLVGLFIALVVPFLIYMSLPDGVANVVSKIVFIFTIVVLVITATVINIEGVLSLRPEQPADEPLSPYPPASVIVAAYLPNEAASVVSTIDAMLAVDYPAPLQIILAYNTPHNLPVEHTLQQMARQESRLILLRVEGSTSKAQNINAALSVVEGEFTAIFDADHHPYPDSLRRAWHWLSNGADVVQGHCVIRNGSATLLSRVIAVEFEQIYAVAHPGATRLRRYGIFGGSNGYWRTGLLREIRMRSSMLTEDIDATMRAVAEGYRVVSDPFLISTELAPVTLRSLTHQRLRWNQGWFQVSLVHFMPLMKSKHLSFRQKMGTFYLLVWREIFPWISLQIFPILCYWIVKAGSIVALDWKVPLLLAATVYVLGSGALQSLIAYFNSAPEIHRRPGWFLLHLLVANLYAEFRTLLTRVAHLRQLSGEREWRVTTRDDADTIVAVQSIRPLSQPDQVAQDEIHDHEV